MCTYLWCFYCTHRFLKENVALFFTENVLLDLVSIQKRIQMLSFEKTQRNSEVS